MCWFRKHMYRGSPNARNSGVLVTRSQIMLRGIGVIYQGLEIDSYVPRMPGFRL